MALLRCHENKAHNCANSNNTTKGKTIFDTCGLVLLEDDRRLFPPYDASPVATHRVLEAHPQLDSVLMRLAGTVDGPRMRRMNRMADEELVEPRNVARAVS